MTAQERPAAGRAEGALVLFHGRGASEFDLLPLLDALDPERRLDGFCPRAPLALPPGGAHWYVVPRVGYPDPPTFAQGFAAAAGFAPCSSGRTLVPGRACMRPSTTTRSSPPMPSLMTRRLSDVSWPSVTYLMRAMSCSSTTTTYLRACSVPMAMSGTSNPS